VRAGWPPKAALTRLPSRFQGEMVFTSPEGEVVDPDNFSSRDWARALRRSKLQRIRFHDLRHTYASLLIAQGAHPKYIQARLGHASIQTTLDRYGHLMPDAAEARKLDRLVFGAEPRPAGAEGAVPGDGSRTTPSS
jgi:integrase